MAALVTASYDHMLCCMFLYVVYIYFIYVIKPNIENKKKKQQQRKKQNQVESEFDIHQLLLCCIACDIAILAWSVCRVASARFHEIYLTLILYIRRFVHLCGFSFLKYKRTLNDMEAKQRMATANIKFHRFDYMMCSCVLLSPLTQGLLQSKMD